MPGPRFSIITPVSDLPEPMLRAMLSSIWAQTFEDWELCLIDRGSGQSHVREILDRVAGGDARIRVGRRDRGGIAEASNKALSMARGDFVAMLDVGDELDPDALATVDEAIRSTPEADFVYSDEDRIDEEGHHSDAFFKPDWSPERLRAQMYVGRLGALRRSLVEEVGGFDADLEGAQEWDLALRVTEQASAILHVPRVLYHRRTVGEPARNRATGWQRPVEAARRAVQAHCRRIGLPARVEVDPAHPGICHLRPALDRHPKVSIVIPTGGQSREIRGKPTLLVIHCVRSIVSASTYGAYEIVCVTDASTESGVLDELRAIAGDRLSLVRHEGPFNFSAKTNLGAAHSDGDHLLLLNDDMEIVTPDWIERMVMYSDHSGIGGVGAQLRWENDRVQHAGVVFEDGLPGHVYRGYGGELEGYAENVLITQDYSAVTGACLMTRRDVFEEVGGFSTELPVNYNDVDYCLKLRASGRRIVYDADTLLYHFESSSRSSKIQKWEAELILDRWLFLIGVDPFSNPNLRYGQPRIGLARRVIRAARLRWRHS